MRRLTEEMSLLSRQTGAGENGQVPDILYPEAPVYRGGGGLLLIDVLQNQSKEL